MTFFSIFTSCESFFAKSGPNAPAVDLRNAWPIERRCQLRSLNKSLGCQSISEQDGDQTKHATQTLRSAAEAGLRLAVRDHITNAREKSKSDTPAMLSDHWRSVCHCRSRHRRSNPAGEGNRRLELRIYHLPTLLLPKKRPDLVEDEGGGGFCICEAVGARDWRIE